MRVPSNFTGYTLLPGTEGTVTLGNVLTPPLSIPDGGLFFYRFSLNFTLLTYDYDSSWNAKSGDLPQFRAGRVIVADRSYAKEEVFLHRGNNLASGFSGHYTNVYVANSPDIGSGSLILPVDMTENGTRKYVNRLYYEVEKGVTLRVRASGTWSYYPPHQLRRYRLFGIVLDENQVNAS